MSDFSYQPSNGPLSGIDFERQTTQFFRQVSAAVDVTSTVASAAQAMANEALECAQASNLIDVKTATEAGDVITVEDVVTGGDLGDLANAREIPNTLTRGSADYNTLTDQGVYAISLVETINRPGLLAEPIVFNKKNSKITNQMALAIGAGTSGAVRVTYRVRDDEGIWSIWSEGILSGHMGDGLTVNNDIISIPEYGGATASAAGTGGLVPPVATGQATHVLYGNGERQDMATLVAAVQA